jgi:hypothetical protein
VLFAGGGPLRVGAVAIIYGDPILFSVANTIVMRGAFFADQGGLLISGPAPFSGIDLFARSAGDLDGDGDDELFIRQSDFGSCTLSSRADMGVILDYDEAFERMLAGETSPTVEDLWVGRLAGPPDLYLPTEPEPGTNLLWLGNHNASEGFGMSAAPAGDFDGDGFGDLIVGASGSSGLLPVPGSTYVVRGGPEVLEADRIDFPNCRDAAIRLVETPQSSGLGVLVDGGFDWNRDGIDDVLVANASSTIHIVLGGKEAERTFVRGDANGDGRVDLSDAVSVLAFLFLGAPAPRCPDSFDGDDNGQVQITDAIYLLGHLFLGGPAPPPPYPGAGSDPSADELDCLGE